VIDSIPAQIWVAAPAGQLEFVNQHWLDYTGLAPNASLGSPWPPQGLVHDADVSRFRQTWQQSLESGEPAESEVRVRRFDGRYRRCLVRAVPWRHGDGPIARWIGTNTDIEDLRQAESTLAELEQSRDRLRLVLDTIPALVTTARPDGSLDFINNRWLEFLGLPVERVRDWGWTSVTHPDDIGPFLDGWRRAMALGEPFEGEARVPRADGQYRWLLIRAVPLRTTTSEIVSWYATSIDIEDRKRAETALQRSEAYLAEAQQLSRTGSFGWTLATGELVWSRETFSILGYEVGTTPTLDMVFRRVHPDDVARVRDAVDRASREGEFLQLEHRLLLPDGLVKHVHVVARAVTNRVGAREFVGAVSDVTAAKIAEEQLRRSETEYRRIIDAIPTLIAALSPAGKVLYANKSVLDYSGLSEQDLAADDFRSRLFNAEDLDRLKEERERGLERGLPFELEIRTHHHSGRYRWCVIQYKPLRDERHQIVRWYATGTDIDDRTRAEEHIRNENVILREEIRRASMFEEIVGTSEALNGVLRHVARVAPTDSTVLITGETGTGKELVARAIHKQSHRSGRAFVSVNCAAIPPSLIASELFGHERGAFTGAVQRRQGKFELADGGTIFLDEVGDLPTDTQSALLRVLQEREFERVGGGRPMRVDVRVIAATNRDMPAAVRDKSFRADLFYRLNVFPIVMPALRDRVVDIPLLVEYFMHRFAKRAGKTVKRIEPDSLKLLQAYEWPGNIRELQNVVERAVIISDSDTLMIDEGWLVTEPPASDEPAAGLEGELLIHERAMIEAALAATKGRISGPTGAAAKLGIPRTTLESKIRTLKLDKHRFKSAKS
jgi:PAS domain S-box-containing protein